MAEEEETREVLFPDWEGPDKTGLTIGQVDGSLFVKEVKGESPAARSGKVYEGDQIVGATIYFDKMSSEETAELLKTLNQHKVGLKLQNKGDKSPLGTPCRSPVSTLTWEGKIRHGSTSPEIILSGDDEDYKRIYTKKIKPRLKSEELGDGVDIRTERHSSTSSDGSTITTVTRRITTYTLDMPSGDVSPHIRIAHGSPSGKAGTDDGVFLQSSSSLTSPHVSSTEKQRGARGAWIADTTEEKKDRGSGLIIKRPNFGRESQESFGISSESGEQGYGSTHISEARMTIRDSTNKHSIIGGLGDAEVISPDNKKGSISLALSETTTNISTAGDGADATLDETTKTKISEIAISHPETKGFGTTHFHKVTLGRGSDLEVVRTDDSVPTSASVTSGISSIKGGNVNLTGTAAEMKIPKHIDIKGINVDINTPEADLKGSVAGTEESKGGVSMPEIKMPSLSKAEFSGPNMDLNVKSHKVKDDVNINVPRAGFRAGVLDIEGPEAETGGLSGSIKGPQFKMPQISAQAIQMQQVNLNVKGPKGKGDIDVSAPNIEGDIKSTKADVNVPDIDIAGPGGKFKMANVKMTSVGSIGLKGPKGDEPETEINISNADIDMKAPKGDTEGPEVGMEGPSGKIKGPKLKIASISAPDMKMPEVNLNLEGLKVKGDVDVSVPKLETDIKSRKVEMEGPEIDIAGPEAGLKKPQIKGEGPDVNISLSKTDIDIKAPEVDIKIPSVGTERTGGGFKMPDIKLPTFSIKDPKVEGSDVNIIVPKPDIDIKKPDVDNKSSDVDTGGPEGGFSVPPIKMPSIPAPNTTMPKFDLNMKGPKVKGNVDVSAPKIEGDIKPPEVEIEGKVGVDVSVPKVEGDIKSPKMEIEGPDVAISGPEGEFKLPKIALPKFGLKDPPECPDVNIKVPKPDTAITRPDIDIKIPDDVIKAPEGGISLPKFKVPSLSGPEIAMPDVDLNLTGSKGKAGVDVSVPKVEGDIKSLKMEIEGPDIALSGPEGVFKKPKITPPKFGLKGPNVEFPDVNVTVPKPDIDLKGPDVDIKSSDVTISGLEDGFKMPQITMPSIGFKDMKGEGPDVGINLPKADINIKAPELDIKCRNVDIKGTAGGLKMPDKKLPTVSIEGPKVEGLDDVTIKVPKPDIDIKGPDVDIKSSDVDVGGSEGGFKIPHFSLPRFGLKGPKVEMPDVDIDRPKADIDIKLPEGDIKGPEVDIEGPSGKIKGPKFKIPSFSGPKVKMPDVNLNLTGPKGKAGVDVSVPKVEGDIKSSKMEIEGTDIAISGPEGGFKMPKIILPKFGLKDPNVECPDVDINVPKTDTDLKGPDIDIKSSDVTISGLEGGFKMPQIKMPSIGFKGMKGEGPDVDINLPKADIDIKAPELDMKSPDVDMKGKGGGFKMPDIKLPAFSIKGPKGEGPDVNIKVPKPDVDIKGPNIDIKSSDVDIQGPEGGFSLPTINMPSISAPNITMPKFDLNVKGPKMKGNVDVSAPKIKGDIKLPEGEIEGTDIDISGHGGEFKMPKIKMPAMNIKGPKVEGGDVDINLPKAEFHTKTPDVDIGGPEGGFKMPKVKMPSFNLKGPNLEGPDVDFNLPKAGINIKTPELDIKSPDIEIEGPKGGFSLPKIKMPSISGPEVDLSLKGSKVKGDFEVSVPKIEGDIKAPECEITGPKLDPLSISGPAFSVSDANLKGPHVKEELDISMPKLEGDIKSPRGKVTGPSLSLVGVPVDLEKSGVTFPKFKGPKFGIKTPEAGLKSRAGMSMGVKGSKAEVSLPDTTVGVDAHDINLKGKKGKFKLPKAKGKTTTPDIVIKTAAVDMDVDDPTIHTKGTKEKKTVFGKLHFPDVEIDIKSPKLKGDGFFSDGLKSDTDFPSASFNTTIEGSGTDSANVTIEQPDVKLTTSKIKMPDVNVSAPDIDLNVSRQGEAFVSADVQTKNVKGSADMGKSGSGGSASRGFQYPEGTVTFPKLKLPKFGIISDHEVGGDVGSEPAISGDINIQAPSARFDVPSQNIKVPSMELKQSEVKVKVKKTKLFGKSKGKGSSTGDLHGPELGGSKDLSVHAGEFRSGKLETEGHSGLSVSSKGKSASLDLFKKSRHRSSSLSDEGGLAATASPAHLEAEGGDISLDLGGAKAKGKKSKLKFGTFGGFGSKSKGSYEVTFGESSGAAIEGSAGASLPLKKSRLSSSSSSDSGSRGGFKFPKLELSVSPKK